MTTRPTRFEELGYRQDAPGCWHFVDRDGDKSVGPNYRTRAELLADMERYAREWPVAEYAREG